MSAPNGTEPPVVVLEEDFFFLGKIGPAVAAAGLSMLVIKPSDPLPATARGVLVDLTFSGDWQETVKLYRQQGVEVVGFGPHVDGALMKCARHAGCSRVMANSKFVHEIGGILSRWASRDLSSKTVGPEADRESASESPAEPQAV